MRPTVLILGVLALLVPRAARAQLEEMRQTIFGMD